MPGAYRDDRGQQLITVYELPDNLARIFIKALDTYCETAYRVRPVNRFAISQAARLSAELEELVGEAPIPSLKDVLDATQKGEK